MALRNRHEEDWEGVHSTHMTSEQRQAYYEKMRPIRAAVEAAAAQMENLPQSDVAYLVNNCREVIVKANTNVLKYVQGQREWRIPMDDAPVELPKIYAHLEQFRPLSSGRARPRKRSR